MLMLFLDHFNPGLQLNVPCTVKYRTSKMNCIKGTLSITGVSIIKSESIISVEKVHDFVITTGHGGENLKMHYLGIPRQILAMKADMILAFAWIILTTPVQNCILGTFITLPTSLLSSVFSLFHFNPFTIHNMFHLSWNDVDFALNFVQLTFCL